MKPQKVLEMRGTDPRTSRMQSKRSTIWATSSYPSSFDLASEQNTWYISFRFVASCQFLPIISKHQIELSKPQKVLEMRGTDPRTSRMQSERSAISATFPYSSSFELASEQNPWYISFRFVASCQFLPIISKHQIELSKPQSFGDVGHRSTHLSHAKRALCHFCYVPVLVKLWASFWTKFMIDQLSICNELSIPSHYQQTPHRIVEASKSFGDAGHRSTHLSHAKQALYHLSYIPVPFKLWSSFWTKSMIYQLSICNELSIFSFCQPEQNRIVEASKMFGDAGHRSPYLSHAKQALYRLSYIPVPFKLWASFWTKSMIYQLSICNELSIPSHYQQTPNRIVEASKSLRDAGHRSTHLSHAKQALYHLSYIPVPFKLWSSFWTKSMIYQLSICNELSIFSFCQPEQNRIVEASKMFGDAGHRSPYLSHAKQALYRLSYIPVPFKLWASFWTKSMIYQLSICNELSIPSHYQQTPNIIVEASKSLRYAEHRSTHLSHAKRALCHFCYVPVLFKLRASFWTKFMIDQLSICNE